MLLSMFNVQIEINEGLLLKTLNPKQNLTDLQWLKHYQHRLKQIDLG